MLVLKLLISMIHMPILWVMANSIDMDSSRRWENINYNRIIDIGRAYTREIIELTIKNIGPHADNLYFFGFPDEVFNNISLFSAALKDTNVFIDTGLHKTKTTLKSGKKISYGIITLPYLVKPGNSIEIMISFSFKGGFRPFPELIDLSDSQTLLLQTHKLPLSAYKTLKYSLRISSSDYFKELTSIDNPILMGSVKGNQYVYEPWNDIQPFSESSLELLYKFNKPLTRAVNLKRDIWVSHWASTLEFEEYYELINDAARLKKGFSRAEFMRGKYAFKPGSYIPGIDMILPSEASSHYYTDLVGVVSTSKVVLDSYVLRPRYPLFGGWKFNFTIGWTNKLSQFLYTSPEEDIYVLNVPIINGPIDIFYDSIEFSLYLPEGSEILAVESPLPVSYSNVTYSKSYFDMNRGHTKATVILKKLTDEIRDGRMLIKYKYSKLALYKKPISIAYYIFVALMSIFLLNQIDLSITK